MRHSRRQFLAASAAGLVSIAALAACGSDDSKDAAATTAAADSVPVTDAVETTEAPMETDAPTTETPSTEAPAVTVSPAMAAFAQEHSAELGAFGVSLSTFAGEATTYLSDVSKAPSAAQVQADARALLAVLPAAGSDAQLDQVRSMAENVDAGITAAQAGDQTTALAKLTAAQSDGEAFTSLMEALMG